MFQVENQKWETWQCLEQPFYETQLYSAPLLPFRIFFLSFLLICLFIFEHITNRSSLYDNNVNCLVFSILSLLYHLYESFSSSSSSSLYSSIYPRLSYSSLAREIHGFVEPIAHITSNTAYDIDLSNIAYLLYLPSHTHTHTHKYTHARARTYISHIYVYMP